MQPSSNNKQPSSNNNLVTKYTRLYTPQELDLLEYKAVVQGNEFEYIYQPNDDTYLMLSTLKQQINELQNDIFICQLGSGSGILSANIHTWLKKLNKDPLIHLSVDINMDASLFSQKYYNHYKLNINQINASLFNNFNFSVLNSKAKPDIIIFNPPYVPVEQQELDNEQKYLAKKLEFVKNNKTSLREKEQNMIAFSYMGGLDGLAITRKILNQLTWNCKFYFIVMGWQGLEQIQKQIKEGTVLNKQQKYQNQLEIMQYHQFQFYNEELFVLKLTINIL